MIKLIKEKIAVKVGLWFVLIAVVPFVGISVFLQQNSRQALLDEMVAHLEDLLHEKTERIELYYEAQKHTIQLLSMSPTIIKAAQQYCSPVGERQPGVPMAAINAETRQLLNTTQQHVGYHDIFLINPDGDIVYTLAKEADLGTNLNTGPYRDTFLAVVFRNAVTLLDSEMSPFAYYPPSGKVAAFIATPIYGKQGVMGVIAAQLNEEDLFYIFTDYIGLGSSGELVAGRLTENGNILAAGPLRHFQDAIDDNMVLRGETSIPIQFAVTGQKGAGQAYDYRGKEIIAAWGYVPSMDWGLVVKIDQDEAFAPINKRVWSIVSVGLATLALVFEVIFFATGSIIRPVKQLALVMQNFASGDFRVRADKAHDDEMGVLVDHFNEMASTIEQYSISIEEQVARRTDELNQAITTLDRAQKIAHLGSWQWDIVANTLAWSDEIYRIFGLKPQQFGATYEAFLEAVHPDDRNKVINAVNDSLTNDTPYSVSHRVLHPDGAVHFVEERGDIQRDETGKPVLMTGTVQDVTEIRSVQKRLSEYVDIIDENVLTSVTDISGNISYVSDAFCRTCGYARDELLGKNHRIIRHPDMPGEVYEQLWKTILGGAIWKGVFKNSTKSGGSYWVESTVSPTFDDYGQITGFTAIHNDISDKKRIEEISITDELTGLFNRRRFNELFPDELNRAKRDGKIFGLIMLDVDNFKKYNDTYGHQKGDDVLTRVGAVLRKALKRAGDQAFRLGGEEFGVTLTVNAQNDAVMVAERLRNAVAGMEIIHEKNGPYPYVTISCGLATVTTGQGVVSDTEAIYRQADSALYQAKGEGRNRVRMYTGNG